MKAGNQCQEKIHCLALCCMPVRGPSCQPRLQRTGGYVGLLLRSGDFCLESGSKKLLILIGMTYGVAQDGTAMLWDLAEGKKLYSLEANETIHALCFSPNRYWLCAATESAIKVCLHSASKA